MSAARILPPIRCAYTKTENGPSPGAVLAAGCLRVGHRGGVNRATRAQFESVIPRHEMGHPEEIASVALFLASDDSSYVNGMELVVDGGTTVI